MLHELCCASVNTHSFEWEGEGVFLLQELYTCSTQHTMKFSESSNFVCTSCASSIGGGFVVFFQNLSFLGPSVAENYCSRVVGMHFNPAFLPARESKMQA